MATTTKRISGQITLHPIEALRVTDAIEASGVKHSALPDEITLDWCGYICFSTCRVYLSIGDYISIEWDFGGPIEFENTKGYGPANIHSYIETYPVGMIDQVMKHFWPQM